jgi:ribonuclease HI
MKIARILKDPVIDFTKAWGFFDGACQGTPGMCDAGALIFLDKHYFFSIKYGVGQGTNNREEFFALWVLMKFVANQG